jgi:hypothetical protein
MKKMMRRSKKKKMKKKKKKKSKCKIEHTRTNPDWKSPSIALTNMNSKLTQIETIHNYKRFNRAK